MGESAELSSSEIATNFDAGVFTIEYFSPATTGFRLQTDKSLMRHEPGTPMPFARRIRQFREQEPKERRVGPGFKPKVGLRNIRQEGDLLTVDTKPVTFPTYRAIGDPDETQEALDIANPTGAASILLTTELDGTHRIILQHRSQNNALYKDIPGASAAGMVDALRKKRGATISPIDTDFVKTSNLKEMQEELGLSDEDLRELRITGIAKDFIKYHTEILMFGISERTADEIAKSWEQHIRRRRGEDQEVDFTENYFVIEGVPEAIETLLTEVHCPLPPTHAAAFVAAGYSLVLERDGIDAANKWKTLIEEKIKSNYKKIDEIVTNYWITNPELIKEDSRISGYDPRLSPQDQGLPNIEEELVRTGLIREGISSSEKLKTVPQVWVFDIDGVLTDPKEKRITKPEILQQLVQRLENHEPIALISGRAFKWVMERIVDRLREHISDPSLLDNLYISGEFGGVTLVFREGQPRIHIDDRAAVPRNVLEEAKSICSAFQRSMFIDEDKKTHFTAEMNYGAPTEQFKDDQKILKDELDALLAEHQMQEGFEVHRDRIATNLKSKLLNKAFAASKVLAWLKQKRIDADKFLVFGDAKSDLNVADEINRQGKNVEFIFVGDAHELEGIKRPYLLNYTQGNYEEGTLERLKSEN